MIWQLLVVGMGRDGSSVVVAVVAACNASDMDVHEGAGYYIVADSGIGNSAEVGVVLGEGLAPSQVSQTLGAHVAMAWVVP